MHAQSDPKVPNPYRPAAPSPAAGQSPQKKSSGPAGSLNRPFVEFIINFSAFHIYHLSNALNCFQQPEYSISQFVLTTEMSGRLV